MSKRKKPTELKLTVVRSKPTEPSVPLGDRIGKLHDELSALTALLNVTSAALVTMAGQSDLAEPQSVLAGVGNRIGAAMDELESIQRRVRALEAVGVSNG